MMDRKTDAFSNAKVKADDTSAAPPSLKIVPLGGVGEFGLHMMAYCYGDEILVVDCGGLLPDHSLLGIDLVIPDMTFLADRREKVKALIITHGHEDHIGATPYFLRNFDVPVYGTGFSLELLREKLSESEPGRQFRLECVEPGDTVSFRHMSVSFLHVNHSICQAVSLALDTPEGLIVHTGDFRIDATPIQEEVFDYAGFAELGRRGVLALFSDSTNVERPGFAASEREVFRELDLIFRRAGGRIMVTLFASSIPRIQQVIDLAGRYGRRVHLAGRSLETNTRIALRMGLLKVDDSMVIGAGEVDELPPNEVVVIMTGSQGEPRSVLARVAMNDHKNIHVQAGDSVIFSSRIVPGHERSVFNTLNHLAMRGADVYYERTHNVHTSGHGHRDELSTMLNLVRPRYFIPIHGEYRLLKRHGELAETCGVAPDKVLLAVNGDVIRFRDGEGALVDHIPTGRIYVDGKGVGDVGPDEVRQRRKIGQTGIVIALLVFSQSTGEVLYGPDIMSRGFIFEGQSEELFHRAKQKVLETLAAFSPEKRADLDEVKEEIRLVLRRFFNRTLERKPVVFPIIMGM